MLEILASKEQADHELSALKKFLDEKRESAAAAPAAAASQPGSQVRLNILLSKLAAKTKISIPQ